MPSVVDCILVRRWGVRRNDLKLQHLVVPKYGCGKVCYALLTCCVLQSVRTQDCSCVSLFSRMHIRLHCIHSAKQSHSCRQLMFALGNNPLSLPRECSRCQQGNCFLIKYLSILHWYLMVGLKSCGLSLLLTQFLNCLETVEYLNPIQVPLILGECILFTRGSRFQSYSAASPSRRKPTRSSKARSSNNRCVQQFPNSYAL